VMGRPLAFIEAIVCHAGLGDRPDNAEPGRAAAHRATGCLAAVVDASCHAAVLASMDPGVWSLMPRLAL
jgi:hypothetical protein